MKITNHIPLNLTTDVINICKPLELLSISLFHYVRVYKNNKRFSLCNHHGLIEYLDKFYKYDYEKADLSLVNELSRYKFALCDIAFPKSKVILNAKESLNIFYNSCVLIKTQENYREFFYFAGDRHNRKLLQFYISNIDVLEQFIFYFKELGSKIISQAKNNLVIPCARYQQNIEQPMNKMEDYLPINEFIHHLDVKRFYINDSTYLTKREVECLKWLIRGKTSEEISIILGIAYRTVVNHIENAKTKLNCYKQTSLIEASTNLFHMQ